MNGMKTWNLLSIYKCRVCYIQFFLYIETQWINGPFQLAQWSVYGKAVRTNNDVEGWHHRINSCLGQCLGVYRLAAEMHKEERFVNPAGATSVREASCQGAEEGLQNQSDSTLQVVGGISCETLSCFTTQRLCSDRSSWYIQEEINGMANETRWRWTKCLWIVPDVVKGMKRVGSGWIIVPWPPLS